jgi:diphosphomevalonate decarboxylase
MKKTARAPANIAFIKYWGKADEELRLPLNSSISMNLSEAYTVTTVEFISDRTRDEIELHDGEFSEQEIERIVKSLNFIRNRARVKYFARVATKNTFPKGTGAAASASGFAALAVAAFGALGIELSEKEVSIFARLGSGSACRSIPDGFVEWEKGKNSDTSYAYSLHSHNYWNLRDILTIVNYDMKKVSTTEGQKGVKTSPFWQDRVRRVPEKIEKIKVALQEKDFQRLGELIEEDCLDMHHVMQTQNPPLVYWNDVTRTIMETVVNWRKKGLSVYFTIDAGPNIHLICEAKDEKIVMEKAKSIPGVLQIIVNKPAPGAHLVSTHLF